MNDIPAAPAGFLTCNVHNGRQDLAADGATVQVNHLVAANGRGGTPGDTVCGLTRFGPNADLPGWSMGGGVFGPAITQHKCPACWAGVSIPSAR